MPKPLDRNDPRVILWCKKAVRDARYKSKRKRIPFNLTSSHLIDLWPTTCPATGLVLQPGIKQTDDSPSLDRVVPNLGYTQGNVVIISDLANRIKSNASPQVLTRVARWLAKQWRLIHYDNH